MDRLILRVARSPRKLTNKQVIISTFLGYFFTYRGTLILVNLIVGSGAEEKAYHRTGLGKYLASLLFHCMYVIVLEVKKRKKKYIPK